MFRKCVDGIVNAWTVLCHCQTLRFLGCFSYSEPTWRRVHNWRIHFQFKYCNL